MSLLRRILRRRDAMDQWRSGLTPAAQKADEYRHAPDAEPEDVPYTGRKGFDGRPLPPQTGGLTGLESGGSPYVPENFKN
jgi:hypothetical protein